MYKRQDDVRGDDGRAGRRPGLEGVEDPALDAQHFGSCVVLLAGQRTAGAGGVECDHVIAGQKGVSEALQFGGVHQQRTGAVGIEIH